MLADYKAVLRAKVPIVSKPKPEPKVEKPTKPVLQDAEPEDRNQTVPPSPLKEELKPKPRNGKTRKIVVFGLIGIFAIFSLYGIFRWINLVRFWSNITTVAWSPDGETLASGSNDNTIILWDAESGKRLQTLEGHKLGVASVAWSPDGKTLASGGFDNTIILWDADSGERLRTLKGRVRLW